MYVTAYAEGRDLLDALATAQALLLERAQAQRNALAAPPEVRVNWGDKATTFPAVDSLDESEAERLRLLRRSIDAFCVSRGAGRDWFLRRLLFKRFWDSGRPFDDAEALAVIESYLSYGDDSAT